MSCYSREFHRTGKVVLFCTPASRSQLSNFRVQPADILSSQPDKAEIPIPPIYIYWPVSPPEPNSKIWDITPVRIQLHRGFLVSKHKISWFLKDLLFRRCTCGIPNTISSQLTFISRCCQSSVRRRHSLGLSRAPPQRSWIA